MGITINPRWMANGPSGHCSHILVYPSYPPHNVDLWWCWYPFWPGWDIPGEYSRPQLDFWLLVLHLLSLLGGHSLHYHKLLAGPRKLNIFFFFKIFFKGFDDLYMSRDPQWQGQVQACVIPEKEISGMWNKMCIVLIMNLNLRWFTRMHSAELTQPREL